jgi:AmmeMemoRadiSam system protein B
LPAEENAMRVRPAAVAGTFYPEEARELEGFLRRLLDEAAREHALEVELPFLQHLLGDFTVVPLVAGAASAGEVAEVLAAVWGGEETRVVVSSDLSHYMPYETARRVDRETADAVVRLEYPLAPHQACGAVPISGLLAAAAGRGLRPTLLDLRNSGDTAGPRDRVVGYGAFAFHETRNG